MHCSPVHSHSQWSNTEPGWTPPQANDGRKFWRVTKHRQITEKTLTLTSHWSTHFLSEHMSPGQVLPPAPDRHTLILHLVMGCSSGQVHWPPPHPTYPAQSPDPSQAALASAQLSIIGTFYLLGWWLVVCGLAGKVGTTHCTGPLCWDDLSCHWLLVLSLSTEWLALISLSSVLTTFLSLPRQSRAQQKPLFRCLIDFTKKRSLSFFGRCLSSLTKDLNN